MNLVIIEGAGKKETIEKYLGNGYKVFATKGHVRDLPEYSLGVNIADNFDPKYTIIKDKQNIVNDLISKAGKASTVFLATDPDREGEAISWHLANILGIPEDKKVRIVFNEISKKAITAALDNPRKIDLNLVDAQQARRVLDRLVGYKVSPVLCKKIQSKLSAGRVQSVALRLVVDREREISGFKPEEYWHIAAMLSKLTGGQIFKAMLTSYKGKKLAVDNKERADEVLAAVKNSEWIVGEVKKSVSRSHASAPFITSTLQQDALNKLNMNLKITTQTAQSLYEGLELPGEGKVALVTYIRTDSTRVSPDAQKEAAAFIKSKFGDKYAPDKPNFYKNKSSSQDAHEAIRPITLDRDPESIKNHSNKNAYRLYKLIYDRFLASQMSEAVFDAVTADVSASDYVFRATGKTLIFEGFMAAYKSYDESEEDNDKDKKLPPLERGEKLKLNEIIPEQKFTKPPQRFTEASLIKAMEENGIGRPATYTPTITTLTTREYASKEGKHLVPTTLGCDITDMLIKYFPDIMDVRFTAGMESKLDDIEEGGKVWQDVIASFYKDFEPKLINAMGDSYTQKAPPRESGKTCPECGSALYIRSGKYGDFLGCSNYPKCKYVEKTGEEAEHPVPCEKCGGKMTEKRGKYGKFFACSGYPDCKNIRYADKKTAGADASFEADGGIISLKPQNESVAEVPAAASEGAAAVTAPCEKCGSEMVLKNGRFGKFFACSAYPSCKNIRNIPKDEGGGAEDLGICPKCGKTLRKVVSKKGKSFISCSGYPDCNFMSFYPVSAGKCPTCGSHLIVKAGKAGESICCADKDCGYKQS